MVQKHVIGTFRVLSHQRGLDLDEIFPCATLQTLANGPCIATSYINPTSNFHYLATGGLLTCLIIYLFTYLSYYTYLLACLIILICLPVLLYLFTTCLIIYLLLGQLGQLDTLIMCLKFCACLLMNLLSKK